MLITNAVREACGEDSIYSGCAAMPGFAHSATKMIAELKRYMITPEILRHAPKKLPDGMLHQKLMSIAAIYEKYEELNRGRFCDAEDDLLLLSQKIIDEGILKDAYIFIDEFSDFLPKHYKVITALIKSCKKVFITIPYDKTNDDILTIPKDTRDRIKNIAKKLGEEVSEINLDKSGLSFSSCEIKFLFDNYSSFNSKNFIKYKEKTKDISLFTGKDAYSEVEYVAKRITSVISNEKLRYSDISVVCGNKEDYQSIIQAVFTDYNIPYFIDSDIVISDHPIMMSVIGLFDIILENWSYDSVFKFLKSGFIYFVEDEVISSINSDDIDFLSAYVLKKGIRGKKTWLMDEDWEYSKATISDVLDNREIKENEEAQERINTLRRKVTAPIEKFINKTKGQHTVYDFSVALFEFLQDIHLYEGLLMEIKHLDEIGMRNEAEQFSKVWNILIEVIDQAVVTLGNEKCTKDEFKNYILSGLSECSVAIIPSSMDCVTVTDADSSVQKNVKALFVVGALRGLIPQETTDEGMLSDKDRTELLSVFDGEGLELGGDSAKIREASEYRFYKILFSAEEKICISYSANSFEGELQIPAKITADLPKVFSKLSCFDDLISEVLDDEVIFSPKTAFNYLMQNRNNPSGIEISELYKWFNSKDNWRDRLNVIKTADEYKTKTAKITPENAKDLYKNKTTYSVSRLNEYSQCPFRYFTKNGLKAKEEEIYQIQKFDLGSMMHFAICRFCSIIEEGLDSFEEIKNRWNLLTTDECNHIIDSIMDDLTKKISSLQRQDDKKLNYLLTRMSKTLKRSIQTVRMSIKKGEYIPAEYEKDFEIIPDYEDKSFKIKGTIDRIDIALFDDEKRAGIRVVDYKSGAKKFMVSDICNMIDIQLVIYALAATELYEKGEIKYSKGGFAPEITAIMYNKLRDDLLKLDTIESMESIDEKARNDMKLNGVLVLNSDDEENVDLKDAYYMDKELENENNSSFLNFSLTKKGTISKHSEYMTRTRFNKLVEYAKKNIKEYNKRIKNGDIKIMPYKDKENYACKYCKMSEICLFDAERDMVRNLCTSNETAWEIIEEKTKE